MSSFVILVASVFQRSCGETRTNNRAITTVSVNNNNNNNNNRDDIYGAVIMAKPLREFTRFI